MSDVYLRSYSELIKLPTFKERLEYLALKGVVSEPTFGTQRYINQGFYSGNIWQPVRSKIITRDEGNDLGLFGYSITNGFYIHHINPITIYDIINQTPRLTDPENLILVSLATHNAIHYGNPSLFMDPVVTRQPFDTCPWRSING